MNSENLLKISMFFLYFAINCLTLLILFLLIITIHCLITCCVRPNNRAVKHINVTKRTINSHVKKK